MESNVPSRKTATPLIGFLVAAGGVVFTQNAAHAERVPRERMAAWHETMVVVDEVHPNAAVLTYVEDRAVHTDQYLLAKLVPHVETDAGLVGPERAEDVQVEDFPGGVAASFVLDGVKVSLELLPLMVGRETEEQEGAALYSIRTQPATTVVLQCGGGRAFSFHRTGALIRQQGFEGGETTAEIEGNTAVLHSAKQPHVVAVSSDGQLSVQGDADKQTVLAIRLENGSGSVLLAYGDTAASAKRILTEHARADRTQVDAYYDRLLLARIETPESVLDEAFRSAVYNLEYNWLAPFGWIECIHHWVSMFHMQQTGGAEWLGQENRSRSCTLSQAERIHDDGRIPLLWPSGGRYAAFGGTNQYFAWQIRHYWEFTADRAFVEQAAPALDAAIAQTFEEYDPEGDLLLSWRSQIGNQEDYLHHPHNSTGPTIEGINMMRTRATLAEALGDQAAFEKYTARIAKANTNLREELWSRDLGRFIYYQDSHRTRHLDGQYQTYIYPLIWDIVDPLDSWTGMRHLRDRLIGFDGEVYCSNNFPNHVAGTWGMQAGAAQQPWGAWGLAAMGLRNEAYLPLRAVARWVMSESLRGSWPEISHESTPAYFSPPAGLYIQSVAEALFGLNVNRPEGYLEVAPCFPDHWPAAELHLPKFRAEYRREANTLQYVVESHEPLARHLRWLLPPCRVQEVRIDGAPVDFEVSPAVGCVLLSLDTPPRKRTAFAVRFAPVKFSVEHLASLAEGEKLEVKASGCRIKGIDDRCGVLVGRRLASDSLLKARIQRGWLKPYLEYGRLGQLNFSRRTFFVYCDAGDGVEFWQPIDLTILPAREVAPQGELCLEDNGGTIELLVRNNTSRPLRGPALLMAARSRFPFDVDVSARSQSRCVVRIPKASLALFSPGDNAAEVILPGGEKHDLTLTASQLYEAVEPLKAFASERLRQVPLPGDLMADAAAWHSFRKFHAYHHPPWAWNKNPMTDLKAGDVLSAPELPAVSFMIDDPRLIPVSFRYGRSSVRVELGAEAYKKLYLLVVPFLDSHNMFAPVGRVTLERKDGRLIGRTLYFPGDLDWWCPKKLLGDFATFRRPRSNRFGLLPQLGPEDADWTEGKPDGRISWNWPLGDSDMKFPQPEFWATCRALETPGSVMNIIEIDLGEAVELNHLTLSAVGVEPAFGLVAVAGETTGGLDRLGGTQWMPPAEFAEPPRE